MSELVTLNGMTTPALVTVADERASGINETTGLGVELIGF